MTAQTKPPRTAEAQITELASDIEASDMWVAGPKWVAETHIAEAEARGRAEALAELRAGGEPVAWCLVTASGGLLNLHEDKRIPENYKHRYATDTLTPLYAHPPVPREAELAAQIEQMTALLQRATRIVPQTWRSWHQEVTTALAKVQEDKSHDQP